MNREIDQPGAPKERQRAAHRVRWALRSAVVGYTLLAGCAWATPPTEAWVVRSAGGSGQAEGKVGCTFQHTKAMVVDAAGNSFVTGCMATGGREDFLTVKYASNGSVAWSARYRSSPISYNEASSIAVDGSGNVYVTGTTNANGPQGINYATVKYDSAGIQLWATEYNSNGNNDDYPAAVAVDGSGNVYVTGRSFDGTGSVWSTVKYNSAGVQQWVRAYSVPSSTYNAASALGVDGAGNVYVTGTLRRRDLGVFYLSYATVKYDSAGGQQWVREIAGGNDMNGGFASSSDLALDGSGNVLLAGTYNWRNSPNGTVHTRWFTVKFDSAGAQQWMSEYSGFGGTTDPWVAALAVDGVGNVYVTGGSQGRSATVKYDSGGVQQWAAEHGGGRSNYASALAVDGSGNVYVVGTSSGASANDNDYLTLKYNSGGIEQWARSYNGPSNWDDRASFAGVDSSGKVYVSGYAYDSGGRFHYATLQYDSGGAQQWMAGMPLEQGLAESLACGNAVQGKRAVATDSQGNTYVTGCSFNVSNNDYLTQKYGPTGDLLWSARYDGGEDQPDALTLDVSGNVYVSGYSSGQKKIVKYNSAGTQQWATYGVGTGHNALAVDSSGNVYATGAYWNASDYNYLTVKLNSAGVEQWRHEYAGTGAGNDVPTALVVDSNGYIYVTGYAAMITGGANYVTLKYDGTGMPQWVREYDGSGHGEDNANALAVDSSGNIYVTGWTTGSSGGRNYTTLMYDSAGVQQWARDYNGTGNNDDYANDLVVDGHRNVYVTGWSSAGASVSRYATVKYDSAGVQQWAREYSGVGNGDDRANALVVNGHGDVYVTGKSVGGSGGMNFATVKYDSAGALQWAFEHDGPAGQNDIALALALTYDGDVVVAGTENDGTAASRIAVQKLLEPRTDALFADGFEGP